MLAPPPACCPHAQGETGSEFREYFPSFLWIVRDFGVRLERDGKTMTAGEYLEDALRPEAGSSDAAEKKNAVRAVIRSFFPHRDCVTMVSETVWKVGWLVGWVGVVFCVPECGSGCVCAITHACPQAGADGLPCVCFAVASWYCARWEPLVCDLLSVRAHACVSACAHVRLVSTVVCVCCAVPECDRVGATSDGRGEAEQPGLPARRRPSPRVFHTGAVGVG